MGADAREAHLTGLYKYSMYDIYVVVLTLNEGVPSETFQVMTDEDGKCICFRKLCIV